MKRISPEETHFYVKLIDDDPRKMEKAVAFTLTDSDAPGWQDVTYYGEGILDPTSSIKKPEWVYVLVNKSMPGICKIGMTTTSVNQRVKEINKATGVITPWFPVYKYKCINSLILEKAVHEHLGKLGYRVNPKREGFEIDSNTAITVIKEIGERLTVVPSDFGK
jgi:hypothetical protein